MSLSITITTPPAFDKKSSEVAFFDYVLNLVSTSLRNTQGNVATTVNVLGTNPAGVPNSIVASYTYTASGTVV
jgi:hypothetical protein